MDVLKKVVHFLSLITYVFILLYAVVCVPILFGHRPVVVLSGSMEPTFKVGSVIYYKSVLENELILQDVISFNFNDKMVSHRIVGIENGLFETKGDANKVNDAKKITYKDIYGKVDKISIPYIGYYIKFVNDNLRTFSIVAVLILVSEFLFSNTKAFDINRENGRSGNNEQD